MTILVHVGIRASDIDRSLRFWRDGLGLRVLKQRPDRCDLTDGYHNFALLRYSGPTRPANVRGMDDYLHVGVGVADLAATARHLNEMGYQIWSDGLDGKKPLDVARLSESAFKVEDPDGITVDVSEVDSMWPGATLHPNAQTDAKAAARAKR